MDRELARRVLLRDDAAALAHGLAGGRTLRDEGLERARIGQTTLAEVARVLEGAELRS